MTQAAPANKLSPAEVTCPGSAKCRHRIPEWMYKRVLDAETHEKLETMLLKVRIAEHSAS